MATGHARQDHKSKGLRQPADDLTILFVLRRADPRDLCVGCLLRRHECRGSVSWKIDGRGGTDVSVRRSRVKK